MSYYDDMEDARMRGGPSWNLSRKWKVGKLHCIATGETMDRRFPGEDLRFSTRRTLCGVEVPALDRIRSRKKVTCKACIALMVGNEARRNAGEG